MKRLSPSIPPAVVAVALVSGALASCQGLYYDTMESLGRHKRDLLVDRVQDARDDQQEAKEQFQSALERFGAVVAFDGGDLRGTYDDLNGELKRCRAKADDVSDRIDSIEDVAGALFDEWEDELGQYADADLRRRSESQLDSTRDRYEQLLRTMRRAEQKMEPVLTAFNDQVLFLKHNLNAQAIASLQGQAVSLESDIQELIAEMEAAIAEANEFIESMGQAG